MASERSLKILDIIEGTSVDGPGLRTSVYLAGCPHHCPGCHNPNSWDSDNGTIVPVSTVIGRIVSAGMPVTFSGGEPLCQSEALLDVFRSLKLCHGLNIWCFTGYTFEQVVADPAKRSLLEWIDVIVDGPFVEHLRDTSLLFRGSSNQRLIDISHWRETGEIHEWQSSF